MDLEWSIHALEDREELFDYIQQDSTPTAIVIDERIEQQVEALVQFPKMGRAGRTKGTRELVIQRTPFVVAYRIEGNTVTILRVLRGAQQWPEDLPTGD